LSTIDRSIYRARLERGEEQDVAAASSLSARPRLPRHTTLTLDAEQLSKCSALLKKMMQLRRDAVEVIDDTKARMKALDINMKI